MTLQTIPNLPYFLTSDIPAHKKPLDVAVRWTFGVGNELSWKVEATSVTDPSKTASASINLLEMPEVITLSGNLTTADGGPIEVTPRELFHEIRGDYDFSKVPPFKSVQRGEKPTIAFTVMSGSQVGGGTIQLYRYANWLSALGFSVTIYSNDQNYPSWAGLQGRYYGIDNDFERYQRITEDIIFIYSILEVPLILQSRRRVNQKLIHLCQGLEEHHFGQTLNEVLAKKPFFKLLNSFPLGRLVVSNALRDYFALEYHQSPFFVLNGIDPVFHHNSHPTGGKRAKPKRLFRVVQVCNPGNPMKGAQTTIRAIALLAKKYAKARIKFHVTFLSGPTPTDPFASTPLPSNISYEIKSELSPAEMKREYQACDAIINGSFHEGFGLSSIEAMASGAILIQADNFGMNGVVEDGLNAIVVPRNNSTQLAAALSLLVENPQTYDQLRARGISVGSSYTQRRQLERFAKEMETIAQSPIDPERVHQISNTIDSQLPSPIVEVKESPKFSVLVPVYNHGHFLSTTLDTLLSQTYPHWEAVIVNDGSNDSTPEVMAEYARRDSRFKTFHQSNGGTAAALNTALDQASNDWICWLSSDDFFKPDKLAIHAEFISAFPATRFFHSSFSIFDHVSGVESFPEPPTHQLHISAAIQTLEFLRWTYVHGNTIAIHRKLFEEVGHFSSEYPNAQDFDMWFRMSRKAPFFYINQVTCTTRVHPDSGTFQFPMAGIWDSYRSVINTLNEVDFFDLIPYAQLSNWEGIKAVLCKVIDLSLDPNSYLYKGTTARRSPLLEKLYSAILSPSCDPALRECIRSSLAHVATTSMANQRGIQSAIDGLLRFSGQLRGDFQYTKIDPFAELTAAYEQSLRLGLVDHLSDIRNYLDKLRRKNIRNVPDLDYVFRSPELNSPRCIN